MATAPPPHEYTHLIGRWEMVRHSRAASTAPSKVKRGAKSTRYRPRIQPTTHRMENTPTPDLYIALSNHAETASNSPFAIHRPRRNTGIRKPSNASGAAGISPTMSSIQRGGPGRPGKGLIDTVWKNGALVSTRGGRNKNFSAEREIAFGLSSRP